MDTNAIEIRGLCKHYKDFSLDNLNQDLPYGCVLGLVGENGAGKSTTIRLIMDALERDGFICTVAGKGSFVAQQDAELAKESSLREIEEHLTAALELARQIDLPVEELSNILRVLSEED